MRAVAVLFTLVLASAASALVEVQVGYHEAVGIPTAEKIRIFEENLQKQQENGQGDRIAGGTLAPDNSHPYFAGLLISFFNIAGNSVCGASLLSTNRLVTAAHCWRDTQNQAKEFTVILGSKYLFSGGVRVATSQVIVHPQYVASILSNDVAMIYLPVHAPLTTSVQPINLPSSHETFDGQRAVAVGFGKTTDQQTGASTVVSHVSLQVISVADCQRVFGTSFVTVNTLCTSGAGGVGVCGGDSGGPLALFANGRFTLIGVSSFAASGQCTGGWPSGFARVTSQLSFINQHM